MVVKVKEPKEEEFGFLRADLTLFTYLHLAAYPEVAKALLAAGTTALAYETVQLDDGALPLLAPMSEVAGRLAPQQGAHFLERHNGGRGVLMGGAPGVRPAKVVVLGAGNVGWNAAWIAAGMEAEVVLIDKNLDRLRWVDQIHKGRIMTLASNRGAIERSVADADLVIGAVLVAGGRAPVVVSEDMVRAMKPRAVIVDVAVDQGGCIETIRETTHDDPVYETPRRGPLRRRQHAGRGAAHAHLRADQRHAALHPGGGRPRRRGRGAVATRRSPSASTPSAARSPTPRWPSSSASSTSTRSPPSPEQGTSRREYRSGMSTDAVGAATLVWDLEVPVLDASQDADRQAARPRSRRGRASLDRPQPVRVLDPPLRRRRGDAARQALAQRDAGSWRCRASPTRGTWPAGARRSCRPRATSTPGCAGWSARRSRPGPPTGCGRSCARSSTGSSTPSRRGPGRHRRRHLRAVSDPDHLRAARRPEGGLEALQPLGHRHAADLQRQPRRGPADHRRRPGRDGRVHPRADRRPPRRRRPRTSSPT